MSIRRALLFAYVEKYGSYVVALGSTIVISRLLTPADIGAFAVAMAFVGLIAVFREFGVSTYIVQEVELTGARISASFTVTAVSGMALALVVAALAGPVALMYDDSRIESMLLILAASFAVTPFGGVAQSLLTREMRFGVLAWIRLLFSAVSAAVGVVLAWLDFGPASLAWATLVAATLNSVVSLWIRPHSLRLTTDRAELSRVIRVGLPVTMVSIVDELTNTIPDLIVGRWQGLAAAGMLSRARGLSQMAHQLIARAANPVFLAVFSERRREGTQTAAIYSNATSFVCTAGWALLMLLAVLADPVVAVLFGAQWVEVGDLLPWLAGSASALLLTSGAHMLLMAHDGAAAALRARLVALPLHLGCGVVGAVAGLQWMVAATVVACIASSALMMLAVRDQVGLSMRTQLQPAFRSLPPALAAGIAALPAAIWYSNSQSQALLTSIVGAVLGTAAAATAVSSYDNPLRREAVRALGQWRK
jgi:O-antigen/teichoic acid export membrane protein